MLTADTLRRGLPGANALRRPARLDTSRPVDMLLFLQRKVYQGEVARRPAGGLTRSLFIDSFHARWRASLPYSRFPVRCSLLPVPGSGI
jgi:hypothetical protein